MSVPELRVHGVSGTPPRDMLYSDPVRIAPPPDDSGKGDEYVRVYRKSTEDDFGVGPDVNAFHWGGLTSGSWLTALWILLLPFSMANLSGWTARSRSRWTVMWVRLFGLVLTGVFINLAVVASVDIYWQWSAVAGPGLLAKNRQLWAGLLFLLIGIVWWAMVSFASTRSHFKRISFREREALIWNPRTETMLPPSDGPPPDRQWEDPAGTEITDDVIWGPHSILHRLRRIHFAFGYFALAFSAAAASDSGLRFGDFGLFDIPTAAIGLLLVWNVSTLTVTSLWRGNPNTDPGRHEANQARLLAVTAVQPIIGAGAFLAAVLLLMLTKVETGSEGNLGHLRDTSVVILFTSAFLLLVVWINAGKISAAASTSGVFFGLIMGAAATLTLSEPLDGTISSVDGLNWIAVGILVWLLIGICVVVWSIAGRIDHHGVASCGTRSIRRPVLSPHSSFGRRLSHCLRRLSFSGNDAHPLPMPGYWEPASNRGHSAPYPTRPASSSVPSLPSPLRSPCPSSSRQVGGKSPLGQRPSWFRPSSFCGRADSKLPESKSRWPRSNPPLEHLPFSYPRRSYSVGSSGGSGEERRRGEAPE